MFSFKHLLLYISTIFFFLVIDFLWLGVLAKDFYQKEVGSIFTKKIRVFPVVLTYLVLTFGVFFFSVLPALEQGKIGVALFRGALFGFICYSVYDLTNLATLEAWTVKVSLVDILWGTFISTAISFLSFKVGRFLL